jgi:hypothetical protein
MKNLLFLILVLSSCAPVYVPNVRNSPLFTKGGEFQASAQIGNGLEVQTALSVSKNIGFIANYSYADWDKQDSDDYHRHKFLEGGIGYFENRGNWCYEIFAGYGKGEASSYDEYYFFSAQKVSATGKYYRYFIQPAFGLNKKMMNVSFVPRFALVDFTEFSDDVVNLSVKEDPKIFFEPAVIGRLNFAENKFFFTFQAGVSLPASSNIYFDHRPFQVSTGLGFRIGGVRPGEGTQ